VFGGEVVGEVAQDGADLAGEFDRFVFRTRGQP
jgi:hypothetical protein